MFRGEHGFIGSKGEKLDGNKANYDLFVMEENEGAYAFKSKCFEVTVHVVGSII